MRTETPETIAVLLLDSEGRALALSDDLDAPAVSWFARVTDARDFLATHLGTAGYRVTDDAEVVLGRIARFRVEENGRNLTSDFATLLAR